MDYNEFLDGICGAAYVSDEDGRVVAWNTAAEQLLGYSKDDVVGNHCYEIIRGRDLSGEQFCRKYCGLRQSMGRGEPICSFRFAVRRASGSYLPIVCSAVAMSRSRSARRFKFCTCWVLEIPRRNRVTGK